MEVALIIRQLWGMLYQLTRKCWGYQSRVIQHQMITMDITCDIGVVMLDRWRRSTSVIL